MKNERELINEIHNVLHAHEDAYVPGAWEEFVKTKKRRRGLVFIRVLAAACVLFLVGYAAWLFKPIMPTDTKKHQAKNIKRPPYSNSKTNQGVDSPATSQPVLPQKSNNNTAIGTLPLITKQQPATAETILTGKAVAETSSAINKPTVVKQPVVTNNIAEVVKLQPEGTAVVAVVPSQNKVDQSAVPNNAPVVVNTEPRRYERGPQRLSYDSIANLRKPKSTATDDKKSSNLSYAVMVSPSVGNQKMNFGTGVEVAYNFNKSFSVSSGIAYAYVNAGSNRNPSLDANPNRSLQGYNAQMSAPAKDPLAFSSSSSQTVQSVKLALSGLEIPLNFQYKTKSGFFLSAGVSAMSVIGNNLSYNVISNHAVSLSSGSGLASTIAVITEESTAKSNEKLNGYVGFYTLSAGKKLNFGRGKLNFAPFIKIPFKGVSSENIQLMHGGVQLGFGF